MGARHLLGAKTFITADMLDDVPKGKRIYIVPEMFKPGHGVYCPGQSQRIHDITRDFGFREGCTSLLEKLRFFLTSYLTHVPLERTPDISQRYVSINLFPLAPKILC